MNMRNIIKYSVFVLLAGIVFACRPHQYPHILVEADSLCEVKPDSAVSLLRSLKPQFATAGKADQMYYQLLCIKANNKNYHVFTSDSSIMPLVQYYEQHDSKRHLAETYYLAGQIYFDMKDAPQALDYYQRAADAITKSTDSDTKILIYYQMADLFFYQRLKNEAISSYRKSLEFCEEAKDTTRMLYVLRDLAFALDDNDMFEESESTYRKVLEFAHKLGNTNMVHMVNRQMASFYNRRGLHEKALKIINDELKCDVDRAYSSLYSIASEIFRDNGKIDSALFCYQRMFEIGEIYAKREASHQLAKYSLSIRDLDKAYVYLKCYDVLSDSIRKMDAAKTIAEMNALYNYKQREKENVRLTINNKNKTIMIIVIILISVFVSSVLIILWLNNRRKKNMLQMGLDKLARIKDEQQKRSVEHINRYRLELEKMRLAYTSTDEENTVLKTKLHETEEKLIHATALAKIEMKQRNEANEKLEAADILNEIRQRAKEGLPLDEDHWKRLQIEVNNHFPEFHKTLYSLFVLSEHEYHITLLMKANVPTMQIAVLTSRSKQAISSAKARMYKKAFGIKGKSEEWDKIVSDM